MTYFSREPDSSVNNNADKVIIMGGGLTGLAAGCVLTRAGGRVRLFERDPDVGGLSRTVQKDGFRFDLGGHRFFSTDEDINCFVRDLMGPELLSVDRSSKIYMKKKFFDYPLKPMNAMFGLGIPTTLKILADYGGGRFRGLGKKQAPVSLEDWVVTKFGRTMFNIYFREYSEKVWGIDCSRISAEWVAQRIKGLSLGTAIKNAFFKVSGRDLPTLADRFLYPRLGIGRISDRLREEIETVNLVHTETGVEKIMHDGAGIRGVQVRNGKGPEQVEGSEFISSMPINALIRMLDPAPPSHILDMAGRLKFRDIVIVAVMVDRRRVTDQTWIYIPEKRIPFGRIHEPTNWSADMAPEGKTLMVMEFFSFKGDAVWNDTDERLTDITVKHLEQLGFIRASEVIGSAVVRAPKAYPLFEIGYRQICDALQDYLSRFDNLHLAGRVGMFRYYNMDHAIKSGMDAAATVLRRKLIWEQACKEEMALAAE